jgi:branched-chain amino acid transport system permease protein
MESKAQTAVAHPEIAVEGGNTAAGEAAGRVSRPTALRAAVAAGFVALLALAPLAIDVDRSYFGYYMFIVFIYVIIAQGWNLVAGYTGQVSLGQNTFFGLGGYTTGLLWLNEVTRTWYYFDPVVMILSGLVPVALAIVVGIPLLSRLRGDYFAFGTLGLGMIVTVLFVKLKDTTGGAMGLYLPSEVFSSMVRYYYVGLLCAVLATAAVYYLTTSHIGLALKAIRDDEISAASHGVPILRYKVFSFAVGAFFAGIGGSLYAYYLFHIDPSSMFNMNWLFYPILICVLGGTGTIIGPVIGSFFISALFSFGDVYFSGYHPIVSGILIIVIMKFLPGGLVRLGGARLRLGRGRPAGMPAARPEPEN